MLHAPRRTPRPGSQRVLRPLRCLVLVTLCAGIRNCVLLRLRRIDEGKRVCANHRSSKGRFNLRHVARDTFAPRRSFFVMSMLGQSRFARPVRPVVLMGRTCSPAQTPARFGRSQPRGQTSESVDKYEEAAPNARQPQRGKVCIPDDSVKTTDTQKSWSRRLGAFGGRLM